MQPSATDQIRQHALEVLAGLAKKNTAESRERAEVLENALAAAEAAWERFAFFGPLGEAHTLVTKALAKVRDAEQAIRDHQGGALGMLPKAQHVGLSNSVDALKWALLSLPAAGVDETPLTDEKIDNGIEPEFKAAVTAADKAAKDCNEELHQAIRDGAEVAGMQVPAVEEPTEVRPAPRGRRPKHRDE